MAFRRFNIEKADLLNYPGKHSLNMNSHQVAEEPKDFKKPDDNNNHDHNVEDFFYGSIHGDHCIDKP